MLKSLGTFFLDIIETVVVALSIFLILYLFIMQPHQVNGQSMDSTFHHGEYVMTDKISYRFNDPQRGDIVVFAAPPAANCPEGGGCDYIKRIIGVPGDVIEVKQNHFYLNRQLLNEPYLDSSMETKAGNFTASGPVVLGPDDYFVSGDNRPFSSDSRTWGPIQKTHIIGKVFFRYWPPTRLGSISHHNL